MVVVLCTWLLYGSRPVLVSCARLWAGPGLARPPLNINALRVNLVNIDVVDIQWILPKISEIYLLMKIVGG